MSRDLILRGHKCRALYDVHSYRIQGGLRCTVFLSGESPKKRHNLTGEAFLTHERARRKEDHLKVPLLCGPCISDNQLWISYVQASEPLSSPTLSLCFQAGNQQTRAPPLRQNSFEWTNPEDVDPAGHGCLSCFLLQRCCVNVKCEQKPRVGEVGAAFALVLVLVPKGE